MFRREDVFTWSSAADARAYIGHPGYFACNPQDLLLAVNQRREFRLVDVDCSSLSQQVFRAEGTHLGSCYFLPAEKVGPVPPLKHEIGAL